MAKFIRFSVCLTVILILYVGIAFAGSVRLQWDPNSEADLAGYKVYWGPASRVYYDLVDVGKVTTKEITGLMPGTKYYFAATAYDTEALESDYSNEVSYTVPAENLPPGKIGKPTITYHP